jgi:hypothetical protein
MADIKTTSVNLVLGSRGITLDEQGRIRFVDPEILQALVSAAPFDSAAEKMRLNVQCGTANNYQCGKSA